MSMYDALKAAAAKDSKLNGIWVEANKLNAARQLKERDQEVKEKERAAAEVKIQEQIKIEKDLKEKQKKELERRQRELKLLSNPRIYPFGYSFPFMGKYSVAYGVVFADVSGVAEDMVKELINEKFAGYVHYEGTENMYQYALENISVWQLDLSNGISPIGEHFE